ncbi:MULTISPECIES: glycosyltransferase [unclassified Bacillus (in: firmicutes)]|uniref:CgeB family protein n=3 Tax=Bacillus TaxID=1386 RepID=UPI001C820D07|nr:MULTISPECIES: glycosyltransferase [unclassified Bacillus (in: firmicutes)]
MKALIIGPSFFDYNESLAISFNKNGIDTDILSYEYENKGFKDVLKYSLFPKLSIHAFKNKRILDFNKLILKKIGQYNPSFVILIKGDYILEETLVTIKKENPKIKLVLWMMDSLHRFPKIFSTLKQYDYIVSFDKNDDQFVKPKEKFIYIPMGYNAEIYYPINCVKDIDFCFVGYGYRNRKEILNELVRVFSNNGLNMVIVGRYGELKKPISYIYSKLKYRHLHKVVRNKNIQPYQLNELYSRSKICLNINFENHKGVNPRTFEIAATNSFQLTDYNEEVSNFFKENDEIVIYENVQDLVKKIEYYLNNSALREEIASKSYKKAICRDSMIRRVQHFLEKIQ